MDARTSDYLTAVVSGDEEGAKTLLDEMFAEMDADFEAHFSELSELSQVLTDLIQQAEEM